jgi:hypothetical protein
VRWFMFVMFTTGRPSRYNVPGSLVLGIRRLEGMNPHVHLGDLLVFPDAVGRDAVLPRAAQVSKNSDWRDLRRSQQQTHSTQLAYIQPKVSSGLNRSSGGVGVEVEHNPDRTPPLPTWPVPTGPFAADETRDTKW